MIFCTFALTPPNGLCRRYHALGVSQSVERCSCDDLDPEAASLPRGRDEAIGGSNSAGDGVATMARSPVSPRGSPSKPGFAAGAGDVGFDNANDACAIDELDEDAAGPAGEAPASLDTSLRIG